MKVLILESKKIVNVNDSYGARLLEQGKAVIPPKAEKKAEKPEDTAKAAPPETAAKPARKK